MTALSLLQVSHVGLADVAATAQRPATARTQLTPLCARAA